MGVRFTEEQQHAIDTLDKSVLVAAAAGSGKTAVLVQRIINIILEGRSNVDEMLVLTFTKAAAAEMRLKLSKAIKKRMQEDPASKPVLRDQLNRLYRSYFSTFDSFAIRVIKEFFYLIDIEPDVKACDDIQSTLMQRAAVDALFDEAFENDELIEGASFRDFLRLYSSDRNEDAIKADIISAYSKLRTMPNYFEWAEERVEDLKLNRTTIHGSGLERIILEDAEEVLTEAVQLAEELRELYVSNGIEKKFYDMLGAEYSALKLLLDKATAAQLDEEFIKTIEELEFPSLQKYTVFFDKNELAEKKAYAGFRTEITPIRNRYKDELFKSFKARYFLPDFDNRIYEMNETYRYTLYYIKLMKAFEEVYQRIKNAEKLLDFADMEHIAVKILENEDAAEVLRKRFNYIFIDEYQDTNNIQEYLISRIAREDNLFKIGDVKQSIYRFRQAEPSIFEHVYAEYSDESSDKSIAIDLNRNFRSNSRTIDYINEIFEKVMEGYDSRARLYFGLGSSDSYVAEYDFMPELHLLCSDETEELDEKAGEKDSAYFSNINPEDSAEEEIESLSKEEAEAEYIAKLVNSIIGTEFNDTASGQIRRAEARDIVILMRSVKFRGDIIARALRKSEVQSHIEQEEDFFDAVEVEVALALMTSIDNMKRDIPLISSLHSEVFGWTAEELAEVRIEHRRKLSASGASDKLRPAYWEALKWYAEEGTQNKLREKAEYAISRILEWRRLSKLMPVEDFIWKLLVDSGYYMIAGAMYSGDRRQANLRVLVDRARKYSENTIASLSSFLDFLNIMKQKKLSNGQASMVSKEDNVVRINTIHKSKGLEYPFVIVGGLGHAFKEEHSEKQLSFDSELGLALHYVDPDRRYWRSSLMQRAITVKTNKESYKEELRILYVALTRARNKLYLVGTVSSEEKLLEKKGRAHSYIEVIRESLRTPFNKFYSSQLELRSTTEERVHVKDILASRPKQMSTEASGLYDEVERRLSYSYPDAALLDTPAKCSVSAIRKAALRQEAELNNSEAAQLDSEAVQAQTEAVAADNEIIHLWLNSDRKKKAGAADIGIAYHRIMEFLDFSKVYELSDTADMAELEAAEPCEKYIEERIKLLHENEAIDEICYKEIKTEHIAAFFQADLGRRAVLASINGKLKKEKAFTLKTQWNDQSVLVQGVIDCCWEENGKMILVDYKSSFINPKKDHAAEIARIQHEYSTQMELYSKALEAGCECPVSEAYLYLFMSDEAIQLGGQS